MFRRTIFYPIIEHSTCTKFINHSLAYVALIFENRLIRVIGRLTKTTRSFTLAREGLLAAAAYLTHEFMPRQQGL